MTTPHSSDVLLVNPPMALVPPDYPQKGMFTRFIQPAINPGLLSIASYASARGFEVRIVDYSRTGVGKQGGERLEFSEELVMSDLEATRPRVVGVSSTSVFDYLETQMILDVVKRFDPAIVTVGGGQNLSMLGKVALHDIPHLDGVVIGEGEYVLVDVLDAVRRGEDFGKVPGVMVRDPTNLTGVRYRPAIRRVDINTLPPLRFDIYPRYEDYIPFVEESRGCWARCNFCPNEAFYGAKVRTKAPATFERDLANAVKYYGTKRLFAFTTSIFNRASQRAIDSFCTAIKPYGIRWTTQTRCDLKLGRFLPQLHESGLFLLNMGLESASPEILRRMNKTGDPARYLKLAHEALDEIARIGTLWTCCNVIFFAGETRATIQDTLAFLTQHRQALKAVVANPLFGFPGTEIWNHPELVTDAGGVIVETEYCKRTHHFPVAPSAGFGLEEMGIFSEMIEKIFTPNPILDTEKDYRDMEPSFFGADSKSRVLDAEILSRVNSFTG